MCAVETAGGSTASSAQAPRRAAREPATRTCGSGRAGASGAGPSRKKRSRLCVEPLGEPGAGLLRAPVLGQAPRELLGGLLGLELGELGLLVGKEPARLQLEQRRDQDEELAARVEVELVALGEARDERDDDLRQVDVAQRELVAQDERSAAGRTGPRTRRGRAPARATDASTQAG